MGAKHLPIADAGYYTTAAEPLKVWVGRGDAANSDPAKTGTHCRLHFRGIQQATNQDVNPLFSFCGLKEGCCADKALRTPHPVASAM